MNYNQFSSYSAISTLWLLYLVPFYLSTGNNQDVGFLSFGTSFPIFVEITEEPKLLPESVLISQYSYC